MPLPAWPTTRVAEYELSQDASGWSGLFSVRIWPDHPGLRPPSGYCNKELCVVCYK